MAIDPKDLTIDYRKIQSMPFRDRKALLYSSFADQVNSALTPSQRANLFPNYYVKSATSGATPGAGGDPNLSKADYLNRARNGGVSDSDLNRVSGKPEERGPPQITASEFRAVESNPFLAGYVDKAQRDLRSKISVKPQSPKEFFGPNIDVSKLPAGMRNNNPGNLKFNPDVKWEGLVGPSENTDQGDFQAVFNSPLMGMRATAKLLTNKYKKYGLNTFSKIIQTPNIGWTPGASAAQVENAAKQAGFGPNDVLDLDNPEILAKVMRGIIAQEHGPSASLYSDDLIKQGIALSSGKEISEEQTESIEIPNAMAVVERVASETPSASQVSGTYVPEGGKLLAEGDLEAIKYTQAPTTQTGMTGYTGQGTTATSVKESYVNNQFLGAADLMTGLGMWPGGENPYFSESTSGKYKFDPKGQIAIDPVHKGAGHYGFRGQLAYDISVSRLQQQAKDAGYDLSASDAHNVVVSMKEFLREQTGGAYSGTQEQKGKFGELYGPQRGLMYSGTGELGHYRHFHYAPGTNLERDDYNNILQTLLTNPDALTDPRTVKSSTTSKRLLNDLERAGFVVKNENGTYTRNNTIMPNQMKQALGLDEQGQPVGVANKETPASETLVADVKNSGMENYNPAEVSASSAGLEKFGITPEKKKKMIEEGKAAAATPSETATASATPAPTAPAVQETTAPESTNYPIKTMAQGGIIPKSADTQIVQRNMSGDIISATKVGENENERMNIEPISKMSADALTVGSYNPVEGGMNDSKSQSAPEDKKVSMKSQSVAQPRLSSDPYSNIQGDIKPMSPTARAAMMAARDLSTQRRGYSL
jgi:hypothetical protein